MQLTVVFDPLHVDLAEVNLVFIVQVYQFDEEDLLVVLFDVEFEIDLEAALIEAVADGQAQFLVIA